MLKGIRIKSYYHILEKDGIVSFIKTLDESIRIPSGKMADTIIDVVQKTTDYNLVCMNLCHELNITNHESELLIGKFLELGILEWFETNIQSEPDRYHRQQMLFDSIAPNTEPSVNNYQKKISDTHVMILGIGGIGNYMAMAFAAAGVGKITIVDFDVVELSNLNRQILFKESDIGKSKVKSAVEHLGSLNNTIQLKGIETKVSSQSELDKLLEANGPVNYLVLSADHPPHLVLWASALCKKHQFQYVKCGYMAYQGLVGPLLGPQTKSYEELFESWKPMIEAQPQHFKAYNDSYIAPSMAATNAILANIAALEIIKDITGIAASALKEKRLLVDLKTMEISFG
ncbi:MAG: ThiF family adenylyltransferase [Bacteroidetes bacterium]|nr:ThiF family adenylyltransferase [Bacteroidota bacterium]